MRKYITVEDLKDIVADAEQQSWHGLVNIDKLKTELSKAKVTKMPSVNNITVAIANLEKLINTDTGTDEELRWGREVGFSKNTLSKRIDVSRPTLDGWLASMEAVGINPFHQGLYYDKWYDAERVLKYLKEEKAEQE